MSMDGEEMIRGLPIDGVVLLSGCDKTTPAMLMGAASADIPSIIVTGGPQLKGNCVKLLLVIDSQLASQYTILPTKS